MKGSMRPAVIAISITCLLFGLHIGLSYYYQAVLQNIYSLEAEQKQVFEDIKNQIVRLEEDRVFSQQELLQTMQLYDRGFIEPDHIIRMRKDHD